MSKTEWFKDTIIYHIFIDRFAGFPSTEQKDKPEFLGGNIRGIIKKLPYLMDLGITTLWISPFYKTSAYHGYHITDFYEVDPHFGTIEDVKDLIHAVHEHNMTIITDFVPNHCSREHPFFKEAQENKNSPYVKWFYFTHWPDEYLCFLSIKDIPKINLHHPPARDHVIDAAKYWLQLGFDGFRLDHVIGPSHTFWKYFHKQIREVSPHAILIGEAWMMGIKQYELQTIQVRQKYLKWLSGASSDSLFREYTKELDGVLDFKFQEIMRRYVASSRISTQRIIEYLTRRYTHFPADYYLPTFLDNHDMDRFLFICGNDMTKLKQAATIQFSLPQPPIVYYGTESGMTQTTSIWSVPTQGDLLARQPMNWNTPNTELIEFYKTLIEQSKKKKK